MKRIEKLKEQIKSDYYKKREWAKLSKQEQQDVFDFIEAHEHLDYNQYAHLTNRLILESYNQLPKRKNFKYALRMVEGVHKTVAGCYGWDGTNGTTWVHPLDREKEGKQ